jgi:hypothetical protein
VGLNEGNIKSGFSQDVAPLNARNMIRNIYEKLFLTKKYCLLLATAQTLPNTYSIRKKITSVKLVV